MTRTLLFAAGLGTLLAASAAGAQQATPATPATPAAATTPAASASRFEFSIANIMCGPEVYGREPAQIRWSPDGRRIAATRIASNGVADVVVLDTLGAVTLVVAQRRSVESSPAWSADGTRLLFTSDRGGTTEIYEAPVSDSVATRRVSTGRRRNK